MAEACAFYRALMIAASPRTARGGSPVPTIEHRRTRREHHQAPFAAVSRVWLNGVSLENTIWLRSATARGLKAGRTSLNTLGRAKRRPNAGNGMKGCRFNGRNTAGAQRPT